MTPYNILRTQKYKYNRCQKKTLLRWEHPKFQDWTEDDKECEHPNVPSRVLQNEADAIFWRKSAPIYLNKQFGTCLMICGNIDGANSFLTCRNDGAMTFLNGWNCYVQAPDDGAGTFFSKKIDGADTFFSKKFDWAVTFFSKKIDWAGTFFSKKIDWAGTFFAKKNDWAGTFFDLEKLRLPLSFSGKYCSLPK